MHKSSNYLYKRNCEIRDTAIPPSGMRRIALQVEYNGSEFHGFQRQKTSNQTVQFELEKALSRVADENITLVCAGRTDAGVHATSQVIHFDTLATRADQAWVKGVNSHLPVSVRVLGAQDVGFAFHARFSALSRSYCYLIYASKVKSTHLHGLVTWVKLYDRLFTSLNLNSMQQAAIHLEGRHDFSSFQAAGCQAKNSTRTIESLTVENLRGLIVVRVTANAFLQHMVRNIVGFLLRVGRGDLDPASAQELLNVCDRTKAPETADADGLYFTGVSYPGENNIIFKGRDPLFL